MSVYMRDVAAQSPQAALQRKTHDSVRQHSIWRAERVTLSMSAALFDDEADQTRAEDGKGKAFAKSEVLHHLMHRRKVQQFFA